MSGNESSRHRGEARHPWGWRTPQGRAALIAVTGASVVVGGFAVMASMLGTFDGVPPPASRVHASFVEGPHSDDTREASPGRQVVREPAVIRPAWPSRVVVARATSVGAPTPVERPATLSSLAVAATSSAVVPDVLGSTQPSATADPGTGPASPGPGAQTQVGSGSGSGASSGSGNGGGTGGGSGTGSGGTGSGTATPTAWPTASPVQPSASPPPTQETAEPSHHPLPTQAKGHQKNPPCGPPAQVRPAGCR